MATVTQTQFIDDIDGQPAEDVSTYRFGVDGQEFEIDLNDKNAEKFLTKPLAKLIEHARKAAPEATKRGRPKGSKNGAKAAPARSKAENAAIRKWAVDSGYEISPRGRLSAEVIKAYDEAPTVDEVAAAE